MAQRWGLPVVAWPKRLRPNYWDGVALPLVIGLILLVAWASQQMSVPYTRGQKLPISLDPANLPEYGAPHRAAHGRWRSAVSLIFSLAYAAARRQEPAGGKAADPDARHSAIGADPGLPVDHRDRASSRSFRAACSATSARPSSPSSPRRPGT